MLSCNLFFIAYNWQLYICAPGKALLILSGSMLNIPNIALPLPYICA